MTTDIFKELQQQQQQEQKQQQQTIYSHSAKIIPTAKGLRIETHVYTMDKESAAEEAVSLYELTKKKLELIGEVVAPFNGGKE